MIRVRCSQCGGEHDYLDVLAGLTVRCKACPAWVQLPKADGAAPATAVTETIAVPPPPPPPTPAAALPKFDAIQEGEPKATSAPVVEATVGPTIAEDDDDDDDGFRDIYCRKCGTMNRVSAAPDDRALRCRKCHRLFETEPEPTSDQPRPASALFAPRPTAGKRIVAHLIDIGVQMSPFAIGVLLHQYVNRDLGNYVFLAGFVGVWLFQATLLSLRGQTIGKRWLGIRIIRSDDGSNPGFLTAVVMRQFIAGIIYGIPLIGFILWLYSVVTLFGDGETLHDKVAGTIVVQV